MTAPKTSNPLAALLVFACLFGSCKACVSYHAGRTAQISNQVARGNLGPEAR